jgi:hypothetical protein
MCFSIFDSLEAKMSLYVPPAVKVAHCIGGWVGPRVGLDDMGKTSLKGKGKVVPLLN